MLEFKKNIEERKTLVKKLEELTGERSIYTRAPEYAFLIGNYKVDRAGNLLVDEDTADQDVLVALLTEGLIAMPDVEDTEEEDTEEETAAGTEAAEEAAEEQEPAEEAAEEQEPAGEAELSEEAETSEDGEPAEQTEPTKEQEAEAPAEETEEPVVLHISFPAEKHTGLSLRNLIFLIHSRAELINKSTGSHFHVDEGLVEALKDDACTFSQLNFRKAVGSYEDEHGLSMEGLIITPEEITFTGFAAGMDADHCKACTDLAAAMNQMAVKQKRIQPKIKESENEKYSLRIWLVRMGMGGDDYKLTRKILMENLTGHSAFRTREDAERAKEKAKRLREERKAENAAAKENMGEAEAAETETADTAETEVQEDE